METVFRTSSMPAAAHAVACGAKLPRFEPTLDPQRFHLCFDDPDGEVSRLHNDYFLGVSTPSRDFYRALQDVRFAVNRAKHGGAR
jgi:hypothetical protein